MQLLEEKFSHTDAWRELFRGTMDTGFAKTFLDLQSAACEAKVVALPRGFADVVWIRMDGYLRARWRPNHTLAANFSPQINSALAMAEWLDESDLVGSTAVRS